MGKTKQQKIGQIGEALAKKHLEKEGYQILHQNYRQKWGEIDLIAKQNKEFVFVEVKTMAYAHFPHSSNPALLPEDEVTSKKLENLNKTILYYLNVQHLDVPYRLDLITIQIDVSRKKYRIKHFHNIN